MYKEVPQYSENSVYNVFCRQICEIVYQFMGKWQRETDILAFYGPFITQWHYTNTFMTCLM